MNAKYIFLILSIAVLVFFGCGKTETVVKEETEVIETTETETSRNEDITQYPISFNFIPKALKSANMRLVHTQSGTFQELYIADGKRIIFTWGESVEDEFHEAFDSASTTDEKEVHIANELMNVKFMKYEDTVPEPSEPFENLARIPEKGEHEIRWEREGIEYHLFGNFSTDELLQMAESISYGEEMEGE